MLFKVILIFLLAMVVVGMVGNLLFPSAVSRLSRRKPKACPHCARPLIGKNCACRSKT